MSVISRLLERRLLFVVGKGGVGKTTVSVALGTAAARKGARVLLVELESENRVLPLVGRDEATSPEPVAVAPRLFRTSVAGKAALEEYLGMVIPIRRVLRAVFDNKVYQYFVAAAPGLRELMTLGKIWFEVDRKEWDLVIVDCPATGHGLQYLRMPKAAVETFTGGLVHREAKRVWSLLTDPKQTGIVVVTLPEEMPVNETIEMCEQLDGELGLPRGALVVNRIQQREVSPQELDTVRAGATANREERALVDAIVTRARASAAWAELNERYEARLVEASDWPRVRLPFLAREEFGLADVESLSEMLVATETEPSP